MTESGSRSRVLLISANRERQPYPVVPNGLACVASALSEAGHDVRFLDLCFEKDPVRAATKAAHDVSPQQVAVTLPPGRAKLWTSPRARMSSGPGPAMTTGMVLLARTAASTAGVL